jgi:hypothetical protein
MDHVKLTPYPFPEGMAIPRLMPYQEFPWNNDGYLAAEVLRLKAAHGLDLALETGPCLGSTTLWLSENFRKVWTCEVSDQFYEIASARFTIHVEPHAIKDASDRFWVAKDESKRIIARLRESKRAVWNDADRVNFIFLDAHWGNHCPLLDELAAIANPEKHYGMGKPCIVIHDFQVPGTDFGFDTFPGSGQPFCLEAIAPHLDAIYGEGGWKHNYPTKAEGACRGWISIEPR